MQMPDGVIKVKTENGTISEIYAKDNEGNYAKYSLKEKKIKIKYKALTVSLDLEDNLISIDPYKFSSAVDLIKTLLMITKDTITLDIER